VFPLFRGVIVLKNVKLEKLVCNTGQTLIVQDFMTVGTCR